MANSSSPLLLTLQCTVEAIAAHAQLSVQSCNITTESAGKTRRGQRRKANFFKALLLLWVHIVTLLP